jgi:magnesium transporter
MGNGMNGRLEHLNEPVLKFVRKDFPLLKQHSTVSEALEVIRQKGVGERIVYFYVVDETERLAGVLPTRRLLTAALDQRLEEVMIRRVIAIPQSATLLEACELFVMHKFLAFPIVDSDRRILGVVDVNLFTEEVMDFEQPSETDVFEAIGFNISQVRDASPLKAVRYRLPWLLATITSGTFCALLAGAFADTLARRLVLAFFLTLVLGLSESVAVQSMTVTIQALRAMRPTLRWYATAVRKELTTALLLGLSCGAIVAMVVWGWHRTGLAAAAIGLSIACSLVTSCLLGLSMPSLLHALRLDPKVAAGPITLALTDISALLFYFKIGATLLDA